MPAHLALVVVVGAVGDPRDRQEIDPGLHGQPLQQVHRRRERRPPAPGRDRRRRASPRAARPARTARSASPAACPAPIAASFTGCPSRIAFERSIRSSANAAPGPAGGEPLDRLPGDVVRRGEGGGEKLPAVPHGEDVPEAHPGVERRALVPQAFLEGRDQLGRFRRGDVARRVAGHDARRATVTRLQRMATWPGSSSIPMAAASIGPLPA